MIGFEEIEVTVADDYRAYARFWRPREQRGAVLYHHGIQSHCGWYETSARRLAEAGYAVLQVDRRGSGRNVADRGHAESADQLIQDSRRAQLRLLELANCDACHVVGVSWGGKLVVASYVADPTHTSSLTLVTPGLFPKIGVSKAEMAKIGMAMLYEPRKHFDIPLNDAELFTTVPRWQEFFRIDKPTLRRCTAGFYLASRRMDKIVAQLGQCPPVPVHLFNASDERIVDNDKTCRYVRELNWHHSRITTYEGARHSLEFENDPEVYFTDLVKFVNECQAMSPT
ncbi:MAG: alpha/beta hydrolase [Planctomycetota bacterium]|jgi:alpha-beta hydrolase superfamily lysophospholipase